MTELRFYARRWLPVTTEKRDECLPDPASTCAAAWQRFGNKIEHAKSRTVCTGARATVIRTRRDDYRPVGKTGHTVGDRVVNGRRRLRWLWWWRRRPVD